MAEPALAPPEDRGRLDVRTRALQHVVERAALEAPGTVSRRPAMGSALGSSVGSALGRLTGSGSPQATVTVHGARARVEVDVAAVWPCAVSDIAEGVRATVQRETARISGIDITTVDVTVHLVDPEPADDHGHGRGGRVQ
ncbi:MULTISPECIES: Asp23/Gls24 family envelope stress response protein [Nocardioides]|uniref:Asp23/Gls24 family envelope stress response protein n=1 Tax=Nocardioides kribbensis TaxID=305517 RepID=A0ABV1NUI4_9ACTN|nr:MULTISPECIES: Asp23/Gls24 family envelope stress response protein [Nocardioides]MCM3515224.1 Asp23/Gls24 family envelope stress response protein [Nocardioides sp. P86]